ncbi:hypothetical protein [Ancylobacter amanitiformis]|uniref:SGNH/GDSL hydrolase family protein n=1 Tax=Ancylobacter amanitiformis TaxID=217069 RepID=A0ABU0LQ97_9HYPH|nr:hypothetical protein [Ancylobacter amanitiformis]MDQ0510866.1 hypothetical protein [Ancylobacter amanitiformis]
MNEVDIEIAGGVTRPMLRSRAPGLVAYGQSHAYPWEMSAFLGAKPLFDIDLRAGRALWYGRKFSAVSKLLDYLGVAATGGSGARAILALPLPAALPAAYTLVVEGRHTTASVAAGSRPMVSLDDGTANNQVLFFRSVGSTQLSTIIKVGGTTYGGGSTTTYAPGAYVKAAVTIQSGFNRTAGMGVNLGSSGPAAGTPAVTRLVIGSGASGSPNPSYDDDIYRVTLYPVATTDATALADLSVPAYNVVVVGDSYAAPTGGVGVAPSLCQLGWIPYLAAIGGSTLTQQLGYLTAAPASVKGLGTIWWDGDNNGNGATAADLAIIQSAISQLTGPLGPDGLPRFLWIRTNRRYGSAAPALAAIDALGAAIGVAYPGHDYDPMGKLKSMGNGGSDATAVAANCCPPSLLTDGVHMFQPPMDGVIAGASDVMDGWGWRLAA